MPEIAEVNIQVRYLRERCQGWRPQGNGKTFWMSSARGRPFRFSMDLGRRRRW
jgi:hypothetical protein